MLTRCASNHGTFYYNQLAAIQVVAGDKAGAINTTTTYFNAQYMNQINSNGEQVIFYCDPSSSYADVKWLATGSRAHETVPLPLLQSGSHDRKSALHIP